MGRGRKRRRLENPVFKMADRVMADDCEILNLENRAFHCAYLERKLPCPHVHCGAELGGVVFAESGLVQHYRVKHSADHIKCLVESIKRQAWRLFRVKHGKETKQHIQWLSTFCLAEVCSFYYCTYC